MNILYTGASTALTAQPMPNLSLGGFLSSTNIRNSDFNTLFSTESYWLKNQNRPEYVCLGLKSAIDLTTLKIGVLRNSNNYKLSIGLAIFNDDLFVEKVQDRFVEPYNISFVEKYMDDENDVVNVINAGSIDKDLYYAIWLKRELIQENIDLDAICLNEIETSPEVLSLYFIQESV